MREDGLIVFFLYRCPETKPVVIFQEEDGRTRYNPTEPTVKILKRPTNGTESFLLNGDSSKTKVPVKSLQQVKHCFILKQGKL